MKTTVVPAQVTTVEDRIVGNLSFSQLMLMVIPVFASAGLYVVLPPAMGSAAYKYVVMAVVAAISAMLAIRIKGKILAYWLVTVVRYNLRPKYYVFNKNSSALRESFAGKKTETETTTLPDSLTHRVTITPLNIHESLKVLSFIDSHRSHIRFETTKKGGLHVRLTEVED